MKVHVQFYAQLRDLAATQNREVEVAAGATVFDLLNQIYKEIPALHAHDKTILVGCGVEFVDRNYKLKPGDEIAIMPPVQGG